MYTQAHYSEPRWQRRDRFMWYNVMFAVRLEPSGGLAQGGRAFPYVPLEAVTQMAYAVTLIPGDGTGPEITEATRRVLEATGVEFDWHLQEAGQVTLEREGAILPPHVLASIRETGWR